MKEARKKSKFEMFHDEVEIGKKKFFNALDRNLREVKTLHCKVYGVSLIFALSFYT